MSTTRVNYTIGVNADTSKFEASLQKAFNSLNKLNAQSLSTGLNDANKSAISLAANLRNAINQNTGKLDLIEFRKNLKNSGKTLQDYADDLAKIGPEGNRAFAQVANSIITAELPLKRSSKLLDELWTTMKNTVRWKITSSALDTFLGALQSAYGYAKNLNKSLNSIQIVTNKSSEEMAKFADSANKAAKALSTTTREYTDASLIYFQQGLSDEEVLSRTETTIKLANAAGISAETASEQLTAIWNNFYDGSKSLEYYADVLVRLGADTASSSDEISEGLEKFAAVGQTVGLSYEYAASALATVTAQTRESASVVGNSFKTLFSRIQGLQLGETQDDGTTLNKYSEALNSVGVNIKDTNGELKDMDQILDELGAKWNTLAKDQQVALAETVGGARQWSQLVALMDNWDFFEENLGRARGSSGSLDTQAQIYAQSWEAARDRVSASAEDVYDSIINEDFFISFDNGLAKILDRVADLIDGMGGFAGVLATVSKLTFTIFGSKMEQSLRSWIQNMGLVTGIEQARTRALQEQAGLLGRQTTDGISDTDSLVASRNDISKAEIDYQIKLNKELNKMNESEKAIVTSLQDALNLKKQEYELAVKRASEAKTDVENTKENIYFDADYNDPGTTDKRAKLTKKIEEVTGVLHAKGSKHKTYAQEALPILINQYEEATQKYSKFMALKTKGNIFSNKDTEAIKKEAEALGLTSDEIDKLANSKNPFSKLIEFIENSEQELNNFEEILIDIFNVPSERLEDFKAKMLKLVKALPNAEGKGNEYKESLGGTLGVVQKLQTTTKDFATNVVEIGNVISSVSMLTTAFQGLFNTLSDDSLSGVEKFTAILGSMGSILPNIISLVGQVGKVKVVETLSGKLQKVILSTKTWTNATKTHNKEEVESIALLAAKSLLIAAIIAAIALLAIGIYAIVKALGANKEAAEDAAAGVEQLAKEYEEAKQKAEELKEVISDWNEAVAAIDELRYGTEEYKKAIEDANEKAKELIETYKLFDTGDWYYDSRGVIQFKEGVLDNIQTQADNEVSATKKATYRANIVSTEANLQVEKDAVARKFTNAYNSTGSETVLFDGEKGFYETFKRIIAENPSITNEDLQSQIEEELNLSFLADSFADLASQTKALIENTEEATKAVKYFKNEIVKTDVEEKYGEQIDKTAGDNTGLKTALTNLYTTVEAASYDKAAEGVTSPDNVGSNAALNNYLDEIEYENTDAGGISRVDNDEDLAKMYLAVVQGMSQTEIDALDYKSGTGEGNFSDSEGNLIWDSALSDEYMRKMIAQTLASNKILENSGVSEDAQNIISNLVENATGVGGADFATAILNSIANGDEAIDLSTFFADFSPEDIEKFKNIDDIGKALGLNKDKLEQLGIEDGEAWLDSFEDALDEYDPSFFYTKQYEAAKANYSAIASLIQAELNGDELTDEQIAERDRLEGEYEELAIARSRGGHEYLELLRQIEQQEENNAQAALQATRDQQVEELKALEKEIEETKKQMANVPWQEYSFLQLKLEAVTEEFDEKMKEILTTEYKLKIELDTDFQSDIDTGFGLISEYEKVQNYLSKGLTLTMEEAQAAIQDGYGALLIDCQSYADGTIRLNAGIRDEFIKNQQDEYNSSKDNLLSQIADKKIVLEYTIEQEEKKLTILKNGLNSKRFIDKTEALIDAAAITTEINEYQTGQEKKSDISDETNEEIATDASNLVNALGLTRQTDVENIQTAYSDAATAGNQAAISQINALNKIQLAAVRVAAAVRASATGEEIDYNGVGTEGLTNKVEVKASTSKEDTTTYTTSEADFGELLTAQDIIDALGGTDLITVGAKLDKALELAIEESEANLDAAKAELGSYNAMEASLGSMGSSIGKTSGSGSGGGSSKTYDKEDLENLEQAEDRYREINRLIEKQTELLDDLSTSTERAWGQPALESYSKEISELQKQYDNYNTKLEKAKKYQLQDAQAVKGYFKDAEFASDGELLNQEELIRLSRELYNEKVTAYNLAIESGKLSEDELDKLKEQLEVEKEKMEAKQEALDQYNETLDTAQETVNSIQETLQAIADKKLDEIKFKAELVLDMKDMQDKVRELAQELTEMFGDALTHGIQTATLSADAAQAEINLIPTYQEEWESLKALYEDATSDADRRAIMDEIQSLQDNIVDSAKSIAEWANSIEEIVPEALEAAAERYSLFTNQLDHNSSIIDTIKELYDLQNVTYKTMEGFKALQKATSEKLETQLASSVLEKIKYEEALSRLQEAQARLDSLEGMETSFTYDAYKSARDALLEEFNEAQESYLASAQETMQVAQDMYLLEIEEAVYKFGEVISNGLSLDFLQEKYDHYIEENERYFDEVNEAYEVSAWYNKLQQDIDDTTNAAYKQRLKDLQEEINTRREGNKLSQYDLDILEAKYQVLQAQMALEDAQNAKNQIQLVRDSQGNWNYQYTANQDQVADAQAQLLEAENEWYNTAKQQVTDVTGEIVSVWNECSEKVKEIYSDMTLTDEERAEQSAEIYDYYTEKVKSLEEEKQVSIADMTEAGNKNLIDNAIITGDTITDLTGITAEEIRQVVETYTGNVEELLWANSAQIEEIFGDNTKFVDLFNNTYAEDLADMTINTANFEEALRTTLDEAQQNFLNYQETVNSVAVETGTTTDDLAKSVDQVSFSTDELWERGQLANITLWEMVDAAASASDSYLQMAASVWEAVQALQSLASATLNYNTAYSGQTYDLSVDFGTYDKNTDYSAMIEQGIVKGYITKGDSTYQALVAQRDAKILGEGMGSVQGETPFASMQYGGTLTTYGSKYYTTQEEWEANLKKLKEEYGLATGGYTGVFDDAKLAFLHQKELVLNQSDTENVLAAVNAVRSIGTELFGAIEKTLDGNVVAAMALMGQRLNPIATAPIQDSIEQTVHIDKVEFPNVTNRTEIEEAFISLTNDAAQWARRRT